MTPPVYTKFLGVIGVTPGTSNHIGPVPPGKIWVVVDIQARMINDNAPMTLGLIGATTDSQCWHWECPSFGRKSFHWSGRQVVGTGQQLIFTCEGAAGDPGEIFGQVTGYELSVP